MGRLTGQVLTSGGTRPEYDEEWPELHRLDAGIHLDHAAVQFASDETACEHVLW
jgi:hypothetical protein